MCGISGYVGPRQGTDVVIDGLRHLEYRGYDSAGLAVVGPFGLQIHKVLGRVADLVASMPVMAPGPAVVGHTRWATHGEPSVANAHPHADAECRFAVVHNGIIENAASLRERLRSLGYVFTSATDTEVLVHLMASVALDDDLERTLRVALEPVEGTYAVATVSTLAPDQIVVARKGSPLALGIGEGEHFVASDVAAFASLTDQAFHLEDGELAVVAADRFSVTRLGVSVPPRAATTVAWAAGGFEMGRYSHFMEKEIYEEPAAVERLITSRVRQGGTSIDLDDLDLVGLDLAAIRRVKLLGCGSAYYAGLLGAQLIERIAGLAADAEPASEFRYRHAVADDQTLYVLISQSGETFDTLQAAWQLQQRGAPMLAVVNVAGSSLARTCERRLFVGAGPEISVTSTKSFTSTGVALTLLAIGLAQLRPSGCLASARLLRALDRLPSDLEVGLQSWAQVGEIASRYARVQSAFFIGRGMGFPVALEGSQKLKEVSYIHAEAYPGAELKHGPLALVTSGLPTIAVAPSDELFGKNVATLEEIRARRGPVIAIGHTADLKEFADDVVIVPKTEPELDPLVMLLPLQMFAYHAAMHLGVDIDKPRNLAKSVTVE